MLSVLSILDAIMNKTFQVVPNFFCTFATMRILSHKCYKRRQLFISYKLNKKKHEEIFEVKNIEMAYTNIII